MNPPKLARIDQSKLRETVYDALRQAFTRGDFAPGSSVSLRALADQLGTSMTPVREAVRRLVAEGALIDTPSRTLKVPAFDARRMSDLKGARLALERLALDQAFEHATPADIDRLAAILAPVGPVAPGRGRPDLDRNCAFHFALYRLSGSEVLVPLIEGLWTQYGAYLNLIVQQKAAASIEEHRHHREIIDAFAARDLAAARDALVQDIERSFNLLNVTSQESQTQ